MDSVIPVATGLHMAQKTLVTKRRAVEFLHFSES